MEESQLELGSGSDNAGKSASVLLKVAEDLRLSRSLTRILSEACTLQADSIAFILNSDGIGLSILKGRDTLKSASMKALWFEPICRWFKSRDVAQWSQVAMDNQDLALNDKAEEFKAACRVNGAVCFFTVRRSKGIGKESRETIKLSNFNKVDLKLLCGKLGMSDKDLFEKLFNLTGGILLLACPNAESESINLNIMQALTNFSPAGKLQNLIAEKDLLYKLGIDSACIVTVDTDDALEALLKVRQSGLDLSRLALKGVVCQGVAKANCPDCARETVADKKLLGTLPDKLRPAPNTPYFVGRGCKSCGNTGFKGRVLVHNGYLVDGELIKLAQSGADQGKLFSFLYPKGLRSLLEDGLGKVAKGMLTLESLFALTRTLPDVYQKGLGGSTKAGSDEPALKVSDDYFVSKDLKPIERPISGKTAFNPGAAGNEGDSPLFALGRSGKVRQRPLLLVVEDDPDQRSILEMVLKSANYDVAIASDGAEGLEAIKRDIPDLIVTDLMMPNMDGAELVSRIRLDNRYKSIPVLVLTVVSDSEKEYSLLDLGADDYCEKTIQRKLLLKRIEALLRRSKPN